MLHSRIPFKVEQVIWIGKSKSQVPERLLTSDIWLKMLVLPCNAFTIFNVSAKCMDNFRKDVVIASFNRTVYECH